MNKSDDLIDRQAAIDGKISVQRTNGVEIYSDDVVPVTYLEKLPSAQPEIIRCKDCKYGTQDEYGRWHCSGLGCQIGDEDGSGFCASAERREDA